MTTYAHALTDTHDYKPDGDYYAPQVILSHGPYYVAVTALNEHYIPVITPAQLASAYDELGRDLILTARWASIVTGCKVISVPTTGFSQGDYGTNFVFAAPEWLDATGAEGITPEDANDLNAWLWGDVYEIVDSEEEDSCLPLVYGMNEAMKYGEIIFPTEHTYTTYDY